MPDLVPERDRSAGPGERRPERLEVVSPHMGGGPGLPEEAGHQYAGTAVAGERPRRQLAGVA